MSAELEKRVEVLEKVVDTLIIVMKSDLDRIDLPGADKDPLLKKARRQHEVLDAAQKFLAETGTEKTKERLGKKLRRGKGKPKPPKTV